VHARSPNLGWQAAALPINLSDPFDRLIIAQAMVEEMTVLTSNRIFEKYPIDVIWCGR
jgi:PIN domain nuclease of toxin-antitoxin system